MFIARVGGTFPPSVRRAMSIRVFKRTIRLPPFQRTYGPPTEGAGVWPLGLRFCQEEIG